MARCKEGGNFRLVSGKRQGQGLLGAVVGELAEVEGSGWGFSRS